MSVIFFLNSNFEHIYASLLLLKRTEMGAEKYQVCYVH